MPGKVLTAAKALIKVKGVDGTLVVIGKIRTVRATENVRRGRVTGLGEITPSELPALEWSGTCNVSQYAIKTNTGALNALARDYDTTADFVKHLLFNEGVDIHLLKKTKNPSDGEITEETMAIIKGAHTTSEGLEVSEGQIGGRDVSFEFLEPIVYGSTV